jgi:hypothetical protein
LTLPASTDEELRRVLLLQLESQFPLPPDQLAWGYSRSPAQPAASGATGRTSDLLVAAVKRDALEEYSQILTRCGVTPVFTLSALARRSLLAALPETCAALDIGRTQSELTLFQSGTMSATRVVPWGSENMAQPLVAMLSAQSLGEKLYLTGEGLIQAGSDLAKALGPAVLIERVELPSGPGRSAATIGLQRLCAQHGAALPLILQHNPQSAQPQSAAVAPWKWAAAIAVLVLASVLLRYGEALTSKRSLARRVAQLRSELKALPRMDRDLTFLQHLQTNQAPYLDALYQVANAAGGGTRLDSLSISRKGDLAIKGTAGGAQQALDLRSKLVESGFFRIVVLDEQTPTPDRQKATFRLTAQLKPAPDRPALKLEPIVAPGKAGEPSVGRGGKPGPAAATNKASPTVAGPAGKDGPKAADKTTTLEPGRPLPPKALKPGAGATSTQ